jgi:hypothetical protein
MTIETWLASHQLEGNRYHEFFANHAIQDEQELPCLALTNEDLRYIGIKIGHRKKLLSAIAAVRAAGQLPTPTAATILPNARMDLIRRLIAIAISVGFVARLAKMDWLTGGQLPSEAGQWEEITRIATAMVLIVAGWEWYHRDVDTLPLNRRYRFVVDILIVVMSVVPIDYSSICSMGHFCYGRVPPSLRS